MARPYLPAESIPTIADDHRVIGNVVNGVSPLLLAELSKQHDGLVLVVANDTQQAHSLEQSLRFYGEAQAIKVRLFSDWETLPYDVFSPHEDIISSRLETLLALPQLKSGIVIVSLATLIQRLPPVSFLQANSFQLKKGQQLELIAYRKLLSQVGYRNVDTVYEHGEYAVRGAILDLFPMGSVDPVRIELFDDEVDSLRIFDPETQRSKGKLDELSVLPANEFPWDDKSRMAFRNRWLEQFPNSAANSTLIRDIKDGIKPHGIEFYTPLFFDTMTSLFDYVPKNTLAVLPDSLSDAVLQVHKDIDARYEDRRHDIQRPILPPGELFLAVNELFSALKAFPKLSFSSTKAEATKTGRSNINAHLPSNVSVDDRSEKPLALLRQALSSYPGRTLIVAESAGRREIMSDLFRSHGIEFDTVDGWAEFISSDRSVCLTVGAATEGFVFESAAIQVITEYELYGQRVTQTRKRKQAANTNEMVVKNLTELRIGSPVVHIDHGVGRYRGLESIAVDGQTNEFMMLEYADQAKLYVPVSSLNLISRYSGTDESLAPLHKLGTEKWSVAKQKAMEKVRDTAAELLEVYAKREAREGFSYQHPGQAYRAFAAHFPFEETPDQKIAINAVIQDMTRAQPMDRLVCGDVGFGKTEVAMRAAFIATYTGRQVAVLVPTTLLAQQHYESFVDRFADTAVNIEVLSRFKSTKEQNAALKATSEGKIDILIGTHKLIQGEVKFKDLGLLIIDEEHRFGVQQKERLKALRSEVDILTMTATPIPRTLNMAMGGLRDLSIIATPPAKRLSVKTFIRERESSLIRESLLREILRGGQVYYLFNDVKNIEKEVEFLRALVPEARVGFAHGQMRERELEQAMSDFYHLRFNILVCSTIIETGIDIPNANTIIIDRADKFGLAQLHQLRGRVGRSHHQAYAYMLTPPSKRLSKDAEKRLEAIEASQELGAGFMLATHDLEIRGAGELLGEDQSGQIQNIGFTLYMDLLEKAVESLKAGKDINLEADVHGTAVNLQLSAIIPDDYLADVHSRLILYKRISNARSDGELKELQVEMIDRFGLLPNPVKNLFRQTELKLRLEALGIVKLDAGMTSGRVEFGSNTKIDPFALVTLVQKAPQRFKLDGATALRFSLDVSEEEQLFAEVDKLLGLLTSDA
jgi:transcription-repair coupling factor (superfamily II helicase)